MKELKKLIVLAGIFVLLLAVLLGIVVYKAVEKSRLNKETENNRVTLCDIENLKTLSVEGKDRASTVFTFSEKHQVAEIKRDGDTFSSSMLNLGEITEVMDKLLHFSVANRFDVAANDVAKYGLSDPQYTITAEKTDGTKTVLYVGNLVEAKTGVYVMFPGEESVIVAEYSFYQSLNRNFENFLNKYVLYLERSEIDEISFERRSTGDRWTVRPLADYDNGLFLEPRYQVTYPMQRDPDDLMYRLLSAVIQMQVSQYVPIAKEDYASYGLDAPEYMFSIRLKTGEEINISLSMEISGYYYGICSNNPYTFRIDPLTLPGLNSKALDLIDSYVIHGYLDDVSSVSCSIKDKSFILECHLSSSMSFSSEDTIFKLDQRNAKVFSSDGECYGLVLFDAIFNMPVSRVDNEAKPELTNVEAHIHVTKTSGETIDLKLVRLGENEYYCFINDHYSGFIVDRSVLYKDNGHDLQGFGVWDAYQLATEAIDNKNQNNVYDRP